MAAWTGVHVPSHDPIAPATQAQSAGLTAEGWSDIAYHAADYKVLDGLAVRAAHGGDMLSEEPFSLEGLGFIAAGLAFVFYSPSHTFTYSCATFT